MWSCPAPSRGGAWHNKVPFGADLRGAGRERVGKGRKREGVKKKGGLKKLAGSLLGVYRLISKKLWFVYDQGVVVGSAQSLD